MLYIVMELMTGGDLFDVLVEIGHLSEVPRLIRTRVWLGSEVVDTWSRARLIGPDPSYNGP